MIDELKRILNINWEDSETDLKLEEVIKRAESKVNTLLGSNIDYENNQEARSLLLNYARYDYNNASEYFEENYHKEILRLQFLEAVKEA